MDRQRVTLWKALTSTHICIRSFLVLSFTTSISPNTHDELRRVRTMVADINYFPLNNSATASPSFSSLHISKHKALSSWYLQDCIIPWATKAPDEAFNYIMSQFNTMAAMLSERLAFLESIKLCFLCLSSPPAFAQKTGHIHVESRSRWLASLHNSPTENQIDNSFPRKLTN